jgi:hypothetical protein
MFRMRASFIEMFAISRHIHCLRLSQTIEASAMFLVLYLYEYFGTNDRH